MFSSNNLFIMRRCITNGNYSGIFVFFLVKCGHLTQKSVFYIEQYNHKIYCYTFYLHTQCQVYQNIFDANAHFLPDVTNSCLNVGVFPIHQAIPLTYNHPPLLALSTAVDLAHSTRQVHTPRLIACAKEAVSSRYWILTIDNLSMELRFISTFIST